MNRKRIRLILTLAIFFAVFSAIAFAIPFTRNTVFWLGYGFGVFALLIQLIALPWAFGRESPRSRFYGFPLARVAVIYLVVQLVLSLLCIGLAKWVPVWVAALVFVLVLAAAALGFIAADATRSEVERQDEAHKANVQTMQALRSKAAYIAGQCDDAETKQALDKLAEAFRYSDPVSSDALADIETNLSVIVDELQSAVLEKDYAAAKVLCAKADATLADRNRMCKLNK